MKIWESLMRRFRQADNDTAKAIDVVDSEKARQIIEGAEKEINEFETQVAGLMASKKQKQKQIPALEANIRKYENFAVKAGAAGNENDVREAVKEKLKFQAQLTSINSEIEKDSALEANLRKQLSIARDRVASSSAKADSLKVQQSSARIRQALAGNSLGGSTGNLSQLDDWEKKVNEDLALAEAREELAGAGSTSQNLTEKYQDTSDIDAEMLKYLNKNA